VQYELRRVLSCVNASVLVKPELFIGQASTKFDAGGSAPIRQQPASPRVVMAAGSTSGGPAARAGMPSWLESSGLRRRAAQGPDEMRA
jgi:hypothetical protein